MDLIGRKLGKYEITEFLGQGGMASVYKAFQPGVERHVAIKVLHPHLATSDDFVARFLREARSSGKLHHPHIMPVIDCDSEAGVHYLVLNYIGGDTLEALLKKEKLLPMEQAVQVASQIGEALTYAHEIGMIHRDIKPANIMFLADDAKHALLADFGIARLMDDASNTALTAVGSLVGTPNYMSPEAAQGETSDERSDIYSLGVVLYEMVTGKTPYQADTLYSFLMKQANEPLPPPSELNPNVPPALEAVIVKSLAKEPANRYESAPAFLTALRAVATPGAVPATQTILSGAAAANEPKKRSMLPLLLAALGVLVVAGGTTFFLLNMGGPGDAPPNPPADLAVPTEVVEVAVATQASEPTGDTTTEQTDSESTSEKSEEAVGDADDATAATAESTGESADGGDDAGAVADVDSPDQESSAIAGESGESEAEVSDATAAVTTVVRKIGQLQIQTGSDGDGVNLSLAQVPLPPADSHYELWLGDSAGAVLNLGPLQLVDNAVAYNAEIPAGALSDYASVLISRELDADENPDEIGTVVISSTAPSQLLPATDLAAEPRVFQMHKANSLLMPRHQMHG